MDFKARFADYCLVELDLRPSTVQAYVNRLIYLERYFGKPIEQVTSDDLRALKRARPWASQTLHGMIVAIRQFHLWGALEGHWERNGISLVRTPRVENDGPPPLPVAQALALAAACCRPLEYRVVYLPLYGGLRIGEAAIIEGPMWGDDGFLRFRGEKTGRMREVPIHPHLEAVKWKILASLPTLPTTLQRVKRKLAARTGIDYKTHQLRKTFSTTLFDVEVSDRIVKHWLGHTQDVTGLYIDISARRQTDSMARLPY